MFNVDNDINAKKYDKSVIMFCSNTCNPCKITVRTISEIEKEISIEWTCCTEENFIKEEWLIYYIILYFA